MVEKELIIPELNNETIESMIYVIRGQKVMLDFELAKIYGYETNNFNRQVKNNIDKFDRDFRFQLNKEEYDIVLKCKNFTSSWGGNRKFSNDFRFILTKEEIEILVRCKISTANNLSKKKISSLCLH